MNILALVRDQLERNRDGLIRRLTKHSERQPKRFDVSVYVHHVTYALLTGHDIPEGTERDHHCNTRHCIEPRHLEPVTHKENLKRKQKRMLQRWGYDDAVEQMEQAK